jgi:hypothetical protein
MGDGDHRPVGRDAKHMAMARSCGQNDWRRSAVSGCGAVPAGSIHNETAVSETKASETEAR